MDTREEDVTGVQEGSRDESIAETGDGGANAAEQAGPEISTTEASAVERGAQEEQEQEDGYVDDDSDGDIPFEPYDINSDGRVVKTASQCSRGSWKRPETGWDVAITVHRFRELSPPNAAAEEDKAVADEDGLSSRPLVVSQVNPELLQLEFRLGEGENEGFPQETTDKAKAAGVNLHPLLHCGIETMGRNERATFIVTADGVVNDAEKKDDDGNTTTNELPPRRCFEYDISLDDWTEEIDLSERQDNSLVKRVIRDGDAVTRPVDIGGVTVRCRVVRMPIAQELREQQRDGEEPGGEVVLFDNLQSQDEYNQANDEGDGLEAPLSFVLDDCPFGPGVMMVLKSMSRGEQCEAWLDPKHGPVDHEDDGRFYHQVVLELVDVEELPRVFATEEVRLEMSSRFKSEGNDKFTAGDYDRALRRYEKAIKYADGVPPGEPSEDGEGDEASSSGTTQSNDRESEPDIGDGEQGEAFVDLQVAVLCNQAACFLKLGDGPSALEVASRASSLKAVSADSPAGIKAAYRRACALEAVGEWDEARDAFRSVLAVAPKNSQCRQGIARLSRAKKAYEARLRKTFGGCLASNKLQGFASEGREVPESSGPGAGNGGGSFDGRGPNAEDEDGPWSEGSESETKSGDDASGSGNSSSSDDEEEEDDEEKRDERVEALYKVAMGHASSSSSAGDDAKGANTEDTPAAADATTASQPGTEREPVTTDAVAAAAGAAAAAVQVESGVNAAPCSEPPAAEVIPISSLKTLAKEFDVVDTPLKESSQPGLDVDPCSQAAEAEASEGDLAANNAVVPPS